MVAELLLIEQRCILRLDDGVFWLVHGFAFRSRKVQRVDDAVLLQAFVHLVHLLADRVDDVLFVLAARFFVGAHLLLLAAPLQADNDDARDDGSQRDGRRDRGDDDDLGDGERGVGSQVAQTRSTAEHRGRRHVLPLRQALATQSGIASRADAHKVVDAIDASAAVQARLRQALVHLDATVFARKSRLASAAVVVDKIVAFASVRARLREAIVHVRLTKGASESWNADAAE